MNRFTLEFGMVAPLWWTTMKCRYPQIRCKALHLLGQAGREGLWDPYLLGQIARECIDIEWGIDKIDGGGLAEALSLHENVYSGQLVELRRRVSEATASDDYEENGVLVITFKRKLWTSNGDYAGNEEIIRRLPYETQ
ncbi:hypothetical protein EV356DRAFT_496669 [Viridothelium virens]|uniref:Uncharacterized protein n=1 Tax=Viridothelium virens TaxID=1048519 RepID=A0A6A6HG94_VIRVR|nr:hypothetical protein EV356DRAFT_496669 [Viridothelium virens]